MNSTKNSNHCVFTEEAITEIQNSLNAVLADTFALYFKTKNFHWHVKGPNFRGYHLLFDEQASAILASTDPLAERVRKIGGHTLLSINQAAEITRIKADKGNCASALDMIRELLADNKNHSNNLRLTHDICDKHNDIATASLLEELVDESEKRVWFLSETLANERS